MLEQSVLREAVIRRHAEHSFGLFLRRTVSAQLHLLGALAALAGTIKLCSMTYGMSEHRHFWACIAYGVPAVAVFGASALYHFLSDGFLIHPKLERWLHDFDHIAIYIFIAGSYTPFIFNAIAPESQPVLLALIWAVALIGAFYTAFIDRLPGWAQHRFVYTALYLFMGWILLFRIAEIVRNITPSALGFLVSGGFAYSIGAVFYALKRPRLFEGVFGHHELWHVMVLLGFVLHFGLIYGFYAR